MNQETESNLPPRARASGTRLTDSVLAEAPVGAKAGVFPIFWDKGFAIGIGSVHKFTEELRVFRPTKPFERDGQVWPWSVDLVRCAEDGETVLNLKERRLLKTEAEANAEIKQWASEIRAALSQFAGADEGKASSDEQDLQAARLKVMREQYPDTFEALDNLSSANEAERGDKMEAVFRAYAVDRVRLDKPSNLANVTHFDSGPSDMNFLLEIAKAHKAKSPYDPVDVEIAADWFAAGYDKMSLTEYARAINAKTGANLKPEAMEARRYKKLGLMTKKRPGPPPKS